MSWHRAWILRVGLLLVVGTLGLGDKPESVAEEAIPGALVLVADNLCFGEEDSKNAAVRQDTSIEQKVPVTVNTGDVSIEWIKYYWSQDYVQPESIKQINDGFIIAGNMTSLASLMNLATNPNKDPDGSMYVQKIGPDGDFQPAKHIRGRIIGGSSPVRSDILMPTTRGVLTIGSVYPVGQNTPTPCIMTMTNADGHIMWEQRYGEQGWLGINSVFQTENGLIISGWRRLAEDKLGSYIIETDINGNMKRELTLADAGYVQPVRDGFILVGSKHPPGKGTLDACLIRMDTKGNVQWERTYGGERNDHGGHGIQTRDGGYIITGSRLVFKPIAGARAGDHPNTEFTKTVIWLIRTDAKGDVRWEKTFDMPSKGWGRGYSVREEADEGFVILGGMDHTGEQSGEAYLIGTDSKGNIQWQVQFGGPGSGLTDAKAFVRIDDGYVVLGSIINTELLKTMQETKLRTPPAGSSLFGSVVVKVRK